VSLYGFGEQIAWKEGVEFERLWDQTRFIGEMLVNEYVVQNHLTNINEFKKVINNMQQYGIIQIDSQNKIKVRIRSNFYQLL
jgi:hypothetical protein